MTIWTNDHYEPRPRAVCSIEDEGGGDPGGGGDAQGMPMGEDSEIAAMLGSRIPPPAAPASSFDDGAGAAASIFGSRARAGGEQKDRAGDVAAALAAAAAAREEGGPDDEGSTPAAAPPAPAPHPGEAKPPADKQPAIDYNALARAYIEEQSRQTQEAARAKLEQEPAEKPKRRLLAAPAEQEHARTLARAHLGDLADELADEDLDAIGREQIELIRLQESVKEYGDDPTHGPRLKAALAAATQKSYTRKLESEQAARDAQYQKQIDALTRKVEELEQAPHRATQSTEIVSRLSTALTTPEQMRELPTLHAIAMQSPEKARQLSERIHAKAMQAGGNLAQAIDAAVRDLEDTIALSSPATAADAPRTKARPQVTQRDAAGSPTRPNPEQIEREKWAKMSRSERQSYAIRGAEEERRRHAQE